MEFLIWKERGIGGGGERERETEIEYRDRWGK
jgi:hypothetical protein